MLNVYSDDESTTSSNAHRSVSSSETSPVKQTSYPNLDAIQKEECMLVGHMSWNHYNREYKSAPIKDERVLIDNEPVFPQSHLLYPQINEAVQQLKQTGPINYGVANVIRDGHWNLATNPDFSLLPPTSYNKIDPPHYWTPPPTYGNSTLNSDESDSIIRMSVEEESNPLLKGLNRCHSCRRRFTARKKTNYWAVIFLLIVAFCMLLSLFPWGILSLVVLACIPSQFNKPTCKKCQRKCC
ncbi:unnamed protein product [Auanema sp. JU1783]|nr:unnamed protein product [Auanema sp. JU1783]